jgi:hypothetical protein
LQQNRLKAAGGNERRGIALRCEVEKTREKANAFANEELYGQKDFSELERKAPKEERVSKRK